MFRRVAAHAVRVSSQHKPRQFSTQIPPQHHNKSIQQQLQQQPQDIHKTSTFQTTTQHHPVFDLPTLSTLNQQTIGSGIALGAVAVTLSNNNNDNTNNNKIESSFNDALRQSLDEPQAFDWDDESEYELTPTGRPISKREKIRKRFFDPPVVTLPDRPLTEQERHIRAVPEFSAFDNNPVEGEPDPLTLPDPTEYFFPGDYDAQQYYAAPEVDGLPRPNTTPIHERYKPGDARKKLPPIDPAGIPHDPFDTTLYLDSDNYDPADETGREEKHLIITQPDDRLSDDHLVQRKRHQIAQELAKGGNFEALIEKSDLPEQKKISLLHTKQFLDIKRDQPNSVGLGPPLPVQPKTSQEKAELYKHVRYNVNTERFDIWVLSSLWLKGMYKNKAHKKILLLDNVGPQITSHMRHHLIVPENYAWASKWARAIFWWCNEKGLEEEFTLKIQPDKVLHNLLQQTAFNEKERYKLTRRCDAIQSMTLQLTHNLVPLTQRLYLFKEASEDKYLHPKIRPIWDALRYSLLNTTEVQKSIDPIQIASCLYLNKTARFAVAKDFDKALELAREHGMLLLAANKKLTELARLLDDSLYNFESYYSGVLVGDVMGIAKIGAIPTQRELLEERLTDLKLPEPPVFKMDNVKFAAELGDLHEDMMENAENTQWISRRFHRIDHLPYNPLVDHPKPSVRKKQKKLPYLLPWVRTTTFFQTMEELAKSEYEMRNYLNDLITRRRNQQLEVVKEHKRRKALLKDAKQRHAKEKAQHDAQKLLDDVKNKTPQEIFEEKQKQKAIEQRKKQLEEKTKKFEAKIAREKRRRKAQERKLRNIEKYPPHKRQEMLNEALKAPLRDVADVESKKWDTYDNEEDQDYDDDDDYDDEDDYDDDDYDEDDEDYKEADQQLDESDFFPSRFNRNAGFDGDEDDFDDDGDMYQKFDDGAAQYEMEQERLQYKKQNNPANRRYDPIDEGVYEDDEEDDDDDDRYGGRMVDDAGPYSDDDDDDDDMDGSSSVAKETSPLKRAQALMQNREKARKQNDLYAEFDENDGGAWS